MLIVATSNDATRDFLSLTGIVPTNNNNNNNNNNKCTVKSSTQAKQLFN